MNTSSSTELTELEIMQILNSIVESEKSLSTKLSKFFFTKRNLNKIANNENATLLKKVFQHPKNIDIIWDAYLTQKAICDVEETSTVATLAITHLQSLSTFIINSIQGTQVLQKLHYAPTFRDGDGNSQNTIQKIETTILSSLLEGCSFECAISQNTDSILFDWNIYSIWTHSMTLQCYIDKTLVESQVIDLESKEKYFRAKSIFNVSLKRIQTPSIEENMITFYVQNPPEKPLAIFHIPCTIV